MHAYIHDDRRTVQSCQCSHVMFHTVTALVVRALACLLLVFICWLAPRHVTTAPIKPPRHNARARKSFGAAALNVVRARRDEIDTPPRSSVFRDFDGDPDKPFM